jgi:diacylglycerol kinase family enzyme
MRRRQLAASVALASGCLAIAGLLVVVIDDIVRGLLVLGAIGAGLAVTWHGLLRRGRQRLAWLGAGALFLGIAVGLLISGGNLVELGLVTAAWLLAVGAGRTAFTASEALPRAPQPSQPVLFMNPRSGGGKATRFHLADEARSRGIEAVELQPGDDLETLVRAAVTGGADALAMAGGDGSQAIVAALASENGLPYACIPAGTRNHFALDLGVDRDDVVGALDAFVDGRERRVDLGEVNGRVFVNNVSLGLYAQAVGRESYRDAKLRTLLAVLPETLGPEADGGALRWRDASGVEHVTRAMLLVSNNPYRLGQPIGSGTRPRLDRGLLGIVELRSPDRERDRRMGPPWIERSQQTLEVDAEGPVPIGVDGEAITFAPPLRFRVRPGALRVRIAAQHAGASPSANVPEQPLAVLRSLLGIAIRGKQTP